MKRLLLLILVVLLALADYAGPVSKEQAMTQAVSFVNSRHGANANSGMKLAYRATSLQTADQQTYYYVFNVGNDGGFVIVSGDDRTEQILGYSDKGSYHADSIPDNMRWWLQEYARQIKSLDDTLTTVASAVSRKAAAKVMMPTKTTIAPLLSTYWDQGNPYWNLCPVSGSTSCYTGCLATAMAQIMYYHRCPSGSTTTIPAYTTSTLNISMPELPAVTFDWDNMLTTYSGNEADVNKTAVAQLMQYAGSSVFMDYTTDGSGAVINDAVSAMKDYFGYDNSTRYVDRGSYAASDWDALIYGELKSARPVLYAGQSLSGGHGFVCDGYDKDNYYHINWGWSGNGNGYFLLSVLNPSYLGAGGGTSKDGFSYGQEAIVGIRPMSSVPLDETVRLSVSNIQIEGASSFTRASAASDFTGISISNIVNSYLSASHHVDYGLALYKDGSLVSVLDGIDGGTCPSGGYYNHTFSGLSFGAGLEAGTYQLLPVSKEDGSATWNTDVNTSLYYVEAVMTATQLTLTAYPVTDFKVNSMTFTTDRIVNRAQEVVFHVTNSGSEYSEKLLVGVSQGSGSVSIVAANGAVVGAGAEADLTFHYVPDVSGDYHVYLYRSNEDNTRTKLYESTVTILDEPAPQAASLAFSAAMQNADPVNMFMYGDKFRFTLSVTNNGSSAYSDYVEPVLFKWNGTSANSVAASKTTVSIAPGETKNIDYEFDGLTYGSKYGIDVYYLSSGSETDWDDILWDMYTMTHGVGLWKADGTSACVAPTANYTVASDAVAVDLQGLTSVTSVVPNNNLNCLYYTDAAAPSGLDGRNVIKSGTAPSVTITDGQPFYAPEAFTATDISYSRIFTKGADGTGANWSTLILPFAATTLTDVTDAKSLDWFHSSTETGKSVWIKDFSAEDATTVYFNYAGAAIEANHPYIIAVAGNKWGEEWDMTGKTLRFSAAGVTVPATIRQQTEGTTYDFTGGTLAASASNVYYINDAGNAFALNTTRTVEPFRAYFLQRDENSAYAKQLFIGGFDDAATPVRVIAADSPVNYDVYSISGVRVRSGVGSDAGNSLRALPRGIYIMNGKKIIR